MPENMEDRQTILLVDDEPDLLESCERILEDENFHCVTTTDSLNVMELARRTQPGVIVVDYKMPGKNGVEVLREINAEFPDMPVVMISAYATVEGVVEAVKTGAFDYLTKPFSADQLVITVRRAFERRRLGMENSALKARVRDDFFNSAFVGKHPGFLKIVELIKKVAVTDSSVLIQGEMGTGKELAARAIHLHGKRSEKPFIIVDCAMLTKQMLESAPLAGNEPADKHQKSVFEAAHEGVLYLEKIEDLGLDLQALLFRILQDRAAPIRGQWEWAPVDVRVIASADCDIQLAMERREFRENLYYLLNVVNINLPALRERKEDIAILADHFLAIRARKEGRAPLLIDQNALARLTEYDWPGNVRELVGVIDASAGLAQGATIMLKDLPEQVRRPKSSDEMSFKKARKIWLERFEKHYLENLLLNTGGNISKASVEAGIARMSLYRMIKRNNMAKLAMNERAGGENKSAGGHTGSKRKK